jgi:alkylated DNA repair dioxygenase AlkB
VLLLQEIHDKDFDYFPDFLDVKAADRLYNYLLNNVSWEEEFIQMFGNSVKVPRLVKWIADQGISYGYSGVQHMSEDWPEELKPIRSAIEKQSEVQFNGLLLNLYRNGKDYMGWHADDEKSLGNQPTIASLSLGAVRKFQFRERHKGSKIHNLALAHGSLLLMKKDFQTKYKHQLPKSSSCKSPRINLTFRKILN